MAQESFAVAAGRDWTDPWAGGRRLWPPNSISWDWQKAQPRAHCHHIGITAKL